jgi:flagellar hook protein FlgE
MYDSLGKSHVAAVSFTKASANSWDYSVTLPSGESTGTPINNNGTLTFNSSGVLTSPTTGISGITFPGMSDGAADMNFSWNLYGASGAPTIAQSASASTATASNQDGYASGTYQSFAVDSSGILSATFSNGDVQVVGQLAIATVANADGLTRVGGNNYQTSAASGAASYAGAGVGSRGTIQDDALEGSNVDISTEFSELIVAQRAFQANSKTITTFDQITQDAIGMMR